MDTNIVVAIPKVAVISLEWTQLIPALIAAIFAFAAWLQSRTIHKAVNSERTAMLVTVQGLRDEILRTSKDLATSKAEQRGQELAAAKASVPTAQPIFNPIPLPPAAAPVIEQAAAAMADAIKSVEPLKVEDVTAKKK